MGVSVSRVRTCQDLTGRLTSVRNIAEQLIDKGLASVVRHKRDDEDRSPDFDKLVVAEQAWVTPPCPRCTELTFWNFTIVFLVRLTNNEEFIP